MWPKPNNYNGTRNAGYAAPEDRARVSSLRPCAFSGLQFRVTRYRAFTPSYPCGPPLPSLVASRSPMASSIFFRLNPSVSFSLESSPHASILSRPLRNSFPPSYPAKFHQFSGPRHTRSLAACDPSLSWRVPLYRRNPLRPCAPFFPVPSGLRGPPLFVSTLWPLRLRVTSFWPFATSSGVRFVSLPPGHFLAVLLFRNFLVVIASIRHFLLFLRPSILPPQPPRRTFSGSAIRGPFFVVPAKLTLQMWVIQTSLLQRTEADRQRIVFLHFILNALCPTDTTVQLVARSPGSRGGCSFCFQSYRDRESIASGPPESFGLGTRLGG